jgi:hypothetical protein
MIYQKLQERSPFRGYFGFFSKKDNTECLLPAPTTPLGGILGRTSGLFPSSVRPRVQAAGSLRGLRKRGRTSAWADWADARRRAAHPHSSPNSFMLYHEAVSYGHSFWDSVALFRKSTLFHP